MVMIKLLLGYAVCDGSQIYTIYLLCSMLRVCVINGVFFFCLFACLGEDWSCQTVLVSYTVGCKDKGKEKRTT